MWHRRVHGAQGGRPHPHRRAPAPRVPRLRLGRDRARRRGGRPVRREAGRQAGQPPDGHRRPDAARGDRPRAHPLGDPRPAERPQRASPPGLHGRHHGHPQRDHRELPRAARRAGGARPSTDLRDRHRGARPPRRGGVRRRPGRRRPRDPAPGRGRLRDRRHASRASPTGWSAPARTCRSSSAWPTARRFLASDVAAILAHTDQVIFLEEGDVADLRPSGRRRSPASTASPGSAPVTTIDWTLEAAEKGGYEHFMLKEIHEQPEALRQAIAGRVTRERPHLARGARGLRGDARASRPGRARRLRHAPTTPRSSARPRSRTGSASRPGPRSAPSSATARRRSTAGRWSSPSPSPARRPTRSPRRAWPASAAPR